MAAPKKKGQASTSDPSPNDPALQDQTVDTGPAEEPAATDPAADTADPNPADDAADTNEAGGDAPALPEGWIIDGEGTVIQRPVAEVVPVPQMVKIRPSADFSIALRGVLISFREGVAVPVEHDVLAAIDEAGAPYTKVGE